jgi:hypothetical protein
LERSTLADWVGRASALLAPLVTAVGRHVLGGDKLHADDTPVPVLEPGRGRTRTGRLWTYVRDDRPAAGDAPPAVWFRYSPDRQGRHPEAHLQAFRGGAVQADGYSGFNGLYRRPTDPLLEVGCWAHVRRKFHDLYVAHDSPATREALDRIGALYAVEATVRGQPPEQRRAVRRARAGPLLDEFHAWLQTTLMATSRKSALAGAIQYALTRWQALTRYRDDGRLEIDNNAAERALRAVALGRNYAQCPVMRSTGSQPRYSSMTRRSTSHNHSARRKPIRLSGGRYPHGGCSGASSRASACVFMARSAST